MASSADQRQLAIALRAHGYTWLQIADQLRARWPTLNALKAMRLARGWTQAQAADAWNELFCTGDDPAAPYKNYKDIGIWEIRRPGFSTLDRLAQLYQCSLADLICDVSDYRGLDGHTEPTGVPLASKPAAAQAVLSFLPDVVAQSATATARDPGTVAAGSVEGIDDDVERRELLAALGGTLVGAALTPTVVFSRPADVAPDLPAYFADQLANHQDIDTRLGPRPLLDAVTTQYTLIRQGADAARPRIRSDLLRVGTGYAIFIGWLHEDMGDLARSRQWSTQALELAHQTEDPNLVASALGRMSYLRIDTGDGRGAVDLANAALSTPEVSNTTRRHTLRYAAEARSLIGDRDGVDQALTEAADLDADDSHRYPWTGAGTSSEGLYVEARQATCYGRLGRSNEAAELWEHILGEYAVENRRNRGVYLARYASTLVDIQEFDAAIAPVTEAVEYFQYTRSARMHRELVSLQAKAPQDSDVDELLAIAL